MTEKKQNSSYIAMLNQALAQFDLQTQVRKVAIEVFESLLKSNNQAFQFIAQSERKFIDFQSRLHRSENFYKTIELSIDNKMEAVGQLRVQFEGFGKNVEFWKRMKEMIDESSDTKKKVQSLTVYQRISTKKLEEQQKDIEKFNSVTTNLDEKIDEEVMKVMKNMSLDFENTNKELQQRRQQIQKLIEKISQSKALLDAKSSSMNQLLQNVQLYKFQKKGIDEKLSNLYNQMGQRVHKTDFNKMRKYLDGLFEEEKRHTQTRFSKHAFIITQNEKKHDQQHAKITSHLVQFRNDIDKSFHEVRQNLKDQIGELNAKIDTNRKQLEDQTEILKQQHSQRITKNFDEIQNLKELSRQHSVQLKKQQEQAKHLSNLCNEYQSNILSIGEKITLMERQNQQRQQQLSKLQESNQDSGDLATKLSGLMEGLLQIKDATNRNQDQIQENYKNFNQNRQLQKETIEDLNKAIQQQKKINVQGRKEIDLKLDHFVELISRCKSEAQKGDEDVKQFAKNWTEKTIGSIQHKLDNLDSVNREIGEFKIVFQKQVDQSSEINKEIGQKTQRMFSMLIKLKGDFQIKLDTINKQLEKKSVMIKQTQRIVDQIKNYLSEINQHLSICLATSLWKTAEDQNQNEAYKISSILEGWVIEIDGKEKTAKYRGECFPKSKLLEMALDNLVRHGDKVKGTLIHSGKEVFNKMLQGHPDYAVKLSKRRSISRRQSELPKLYK